MLYDRLNFDLVRDIAPVGSVNRSPGVMEGSIRFQRPMSMSVTNITCRDSGAICL